MNEDARLERIFADALSQSAPTRAPDRLRAAITTSVSQTRPRPRWLALLKEPHMRTRSTVAVGIPIVRPSSVPLLRLAWILFIILLAVALAAGGAVIGSRLLGTTYPIPQGGAAVLAFEANGDIFTVRADGSDLRQLTSGPGSDEHPTWSPDGKLIAYRHLDGSRDSLVVMDAGGAHPVTLDERVTQDPCEHRWSTTWSPDSTGLIFPVGSSCLGGGFESYIVGADGRAPATRLVGPRIDSMWATWSPDGTRLAFLGRESGGLDGLHIVDASPAEALVGGLQPHRIGPDLAYDFIDEPSRPQWSTDGSEVAVVNGRDGVFAIAADGSSLRLLAGDDAHNPAWSPDGMRLTFHRTVDPSEYFNDRPCTVRTWVAAADGGHARRLDELGDGCESTPLWSPDGTRLASILVVQGPGDPGPGFHAGIVTVDGSSPLTLLPVGRPGSWQPYAVPLPPAPSFALDAPAS
jgi:dipeptidyl aminopeptidase/acylaminoacyl peptidase